MPEVMAARLEDLKPEALVQGLVGREAVRVASRFGIYAGAEETQLELIRRHEMNGDLDRDVAVLFHNLRQSGNAATHRLEGEHSTALNCLKVDWQLSLWFHSTFGDSAYCSGQFQPPSPPEKQSSADDALNEELEALKLGYEQTQAKETEHTQALKIQTRELNESLGLQKKWESLAEESEAEVEK